MACLDMYSSSSSSSNNNNNQTSDGHNKSLPCSSPRISFSNDFAEQHHHQHHHHHHKPRSDHPPPPPSADFEFSSSVSNHSMMSADELFSKGRLLPFKKPTTLREELLTADDDDEEEDGGGFSLRPPKGSGSGSMRWKEILGLKKSHNVGSRKTGKGDGCGDRRPGLVRDPEPTASYQEFTGTVERWTVE